MKDKLVSVKQASKSVTHGLYAKAFSNIERKNASGRSGKIAASECASI
jgi:hypothetical protein